MTRLLIVFFLLLCGSASLAGPPLTLTLPDDGSYSYWIESRNGSVTTLPVNVAHQETVTIRAALSRGDQVVVLDAYTGQWAEHPISIAADGKPSALTFATGEFHPLSAPPAASSTPAPPAAAVPAEPDADAGGSRLLTGFVSLVLAGAVGWLLSYLVRTRGAPLRTLARQVGIETPEPPPAASGSDQNPIYRLSRRLPEAVPEEAGRSVSLNGTELQRGPEIPLAEAATLIGVQGLAAGSTFALTVGDVTIGRDGENEIVLAENTVSRYHARLLRQSNGQFALTDLGSANGVYVNGTRVQRAILRSGDQVKVGDNYFRFQMNSEVK